MGSCNPSHLSLHEFAPPQEALSIIDNESEKSDQQVEKKTAISTSITIARKIVPLVPYEYTLPEKASGDALPQETNKNEDRPFTLFPDLPPELRLHIWSLAVNDLGPRNVVFTLAKKNEIYLKTITPPPALLHTCHESRVEASRMYEKAFKIPSKDGEVIEMGYVAPSIDTVIILNSWHLHTFSPGRRVDANYLVSAWLPTYRGTSILRIRLERSVPRRDKAPNVKCHALIYPRLRNASDV